jgi:O-methyltransferase
MKFPKNVKNIVLKFLQSVFGLVGLEIFVRRPGSHYAPNYFGRSSHKQQDIRTLPIFGEMAGKVIRDGRATLYYDRLFTIFQVVSNLNVRAKQDGQVVQTAEVGVYKGGTSYFVASLAEKLDMQIRHRCFDTFEGHAAEDINKTIEIGHKPANFNDTSFDSVTEYLKRFANIEIHKGRIQDTARAIQDTPMHFVHLDMDIYEPTIFALKFFNDRMTKGGVILLDDYGFATCPGIERAVNEFMAYSKNYFGIALISGQYLLVRL